MEIKTNAKIRVRLESFNHELLVSSCQKIINILQKMENKTTLEIIIESAEFAKEFYYFITVNLDGNTEKVIN